ncbi:MAG: hypothetical protein ABSF75_04045 [Terracidiphilus sp.]|jgi:hypothetical protein
MSVKGGSGVRGDWGICGVAQVYSRLFDQQTPETLWQKIEAQFTVGQ